MPCRVTTGSSWLVRPIEAARGGFGKAIIQSTTSPSIMDRRISSSRRGESCLRCSSGCRRQCRAKLQKNRVGFGAHREGRAVEQRFFGRPPRGLEHEIRARLAGERGSAIDLLALFGLDPQIEGVASWNMPPPV